MSWDIVVIDCPSDVEALKDIPAGFDPQPLGKRADIISGIQKLVAAATDFSEDGWGGFRGEGFSVEVSLGSEEHTQSMMFYVRGNNVVVIDVIDQILQTLNLRAFDAGNGERFRPASARESFQAWQKFRDQVLKR